MNYLTPLRRRTAQALLLLLAGTAVVAWAFPAYLQPDHLIDFLVLGSLCG